VAAKNFVSRYKQENWLLAWKLSVDLQKRMAKYML